MKVEIIKEYSLVNYEIPGIYRFRLGHSVDLFLCSDCDTNSNTDITLVCIQSPDNTRIGKILKYSIENFRKYEPVLFRGTIEISN